jgi:hypothetical protein
LTRTVAETVARLRSVLEAETAALREGKPLDLLANSDTKARILLELTRKREPDEESLLTGSDVQELLAVLAENAQMLERHMAAVNQVAETIASAIRAEDSDGTYSPAAGRRVA